MAYVTNVNGLNPGPDTVNTDNQIPVIYDNDQQALLIGGGAPVVLGSSQLPANIMAQGSRHSAPTGVILGDSTMAYFWEPITPAATTSVTGAGTTVTVNSNFQPVLDGAILNCDAAGTPFNQFQIQATSVNNTTFTFQSPAPFFGNPAVIPVFSNSMLYNNRSFIVWANRLMGQKLNIVNNACFGGNTTAQMLARIPTQVLPYKPSYCIVLGGINDSGTLTAAQIMSNLAQIYTLLMANNITPIALTILPLSASYGGGGASFTGPTTVLLQTNQLIKNYCYANNITCIDTFSQMVDTTQTTGQGVSTYYCSSVSDYVHPSVQAARYVGTAIANALQNLFPAPALYGTNAADTYGTSSTNYNLADQAPYASSGGTLSNTGGGTAPTGTLPTNFTVNHVDNTTGTCVASVVARTVAADGDTVGNNAQLVITAGSGSLDQWTLQVTPDLTTRLVPGGTYQFRCKLKLTNVSGSKLYDIANQWLINDSASTRTGYTGVYTDVTVVNDSQFADGSTAVTYDWATAPFTCPQWAHSGAAVVFYFYFSAAVGTAVTIDVGRCTFQRLS